jgi:hypothetical protein
MADVFGWYNITPSGVLPAENMGEGFKGALFKPPE